MAKSLDQTPPESQLAASNPKCTEKLSDFRKIFESGKKCVFTKWGKKHVDHSILASLNLQV